MTTIVQSLHLYPVKACRAVDVESLTIGPTGPSVDRSWQVVGADGQPITQRLAPVLATVEVDLIAGSGLRLGAEGHGSVEVAAPRPGAGTVPVRALTGAEVRAGDGGDEVAGWLADLLGRPARLVAMVEATSIRLPAPIDLWGGDISFADAAPVLVANQASCDWLAERASEPFGIDRFRANIVVSGAEPWVEDTWESFTIGGGGNGAVGGVAFEAKLPWPRCAVPQVDQMTGERHREPARILRAHRWCESAPSLAAGPRAMVEGKGLFGVACHAPLGGRITVGAEIEITSTTEPILARPDSRSADAGIEGPHQGVDD